MRCPCFAPSLRVSSDESDRSTSDRSGTWALLGIMLSHLTQDGPPARVESRGECASHASAAVHRSCFRRVLWQVLHQRMRYGPERCEAAKNGGTKRAWR